MNRSKIYKKFKVMHLNKILLVASIVVFGTVQPIIEFAGKIADNHSFFLKVVDTSIKTCLTYLWSNNPRAGISNIKEVYDINRVLIKRETEQFKHPLLHKSTLYILLPILYSFTESIITFAYRASHYQIVDSEQARKTIALSSIATLLTQTIGLLSQEYHNDYSSFELSCIVQWFVNEAVKFIPFLERKTGAEIEDSIETILCLIRPFTGTLAYLITAIEAKKSSNFSLWIAIRNSLIYHTLIGENELLNNFLLRGVYWFYRHYELPWKIAPAWGSRRIIAAMADDINNNIFDPNIVFRNLPNHLSKEQKTSLLKTIYKGYNIQALLNIKINKIKKAPPEPKYPSQILLLCESIKNYQNLC